MSQEQQIPLETPEFNVRTGAPTATQKIAVRKPLEISDVTTKKGKWLSDKLSSLYNDPKYKTASPEQQKAYKSLAYTKWVQPYYTKVLKTNAPTKEDWLTGSTHSLEGTTVKDRPIEGAYKKVGQEIGLHTMKATTDITAGLLHDLSYVGRAIDYIAGKEDLKPGEKSLEQHIESLSQGVKDKTGAYWNDRLREQHNDQKPTLKNDVPGKIAEFGTQAVFFEATGAAKGAKLLNVANPKTAALAVQMAKASWNGAVDFAGWSASQGETPQEVAKSGVEGAVGGAVLKSAQRTGLDPLFGMFKDLFKWGGKEATQQVVNEAITKALTKIEPTPSPETSALSAQSRKASTIAATELEKYSQEKFKKSFKELAYIQRQHVLNKLLTLSSDAIQTASSEGMPKQLVQAQAQEQDDLMAQIFPEAKASQQQVEAFVKQSGLEPQSTKLLATLPHHNTTIDSPWKHLQARASFLKSQLRTAKGAEREDLQKALNEEYTLMKEKSAKQKTTPKGTVGGAAANDPKVFKDDYVVTPNIDPYNTGFAEWRADIFASSVAQASKNQALAKGQQQSFLANAIQNSFMVGSNLSRKAFLQEGVTKQLIHPKYGMVGGINYETQLAHTLGERSGLNPRDPMVYINWLGLRPNVVARAWPVKGAGQTLFLNAAMEADRINAGIALTPYDESKSFYEKMGMREVGSYMVMSKEEVKTLLKNKGLLMMLLGAGISYGMQDKNLTEGDYSVKGSN